MNADERGFKTRRLTDLKSVFFSLLKRGLGVPFPAVTVR
jgi:hypothetical protein